MKVRFLSHLPRLPSFLNTGDVSRQRAYPRRWKRSSARSRGAAGQRGASWPRRPGFSARATARAELPGLAGAPAFAEIVVGIPDPQG